MDYLKKISCEDLVINKYSEFKFCINEKISHIFNRSGNTGIL